MSIKGRIISFILFYMIFGSTLSVSLDSSLFDREGGNSARSASAPQLREQCPSIQSYGAASSGSAPPPLLGSWSRSSLTNADIDALLADEKNRAMIDEFNSKLSVRSERLPEVAEWPVELREPLTERSLTPLDAELQEKKGKWVRYRWALGKPTRANFDTVENSKWQEARDVVIDSLCTRADGLIHVERASEIQIREAFKTFSGPVIAVTELGGVFFNFANRESRDVVVVPIVALSALLGLTATQADVPLAVVSLGETFNLAISGPGSDTIMALVTSLSLLPYTHQYSKLFLTLVRHWYKEPLNKMRRKESGLQGAAKVMVVLSSLVRAGVKLAYLLALESDSSVKGGRVFAAIVGGPSVFSEWLWQMKVGRTALDNSYHLNMRDALTDNKRRIIRKGIENCLLRASQDSVFCDKVFGVVKSNFRSHFHFEQWIIESVALNSTRMDREVALSALFLIHGSHRTQDTAFGCDFQTISSDLQGGTFSRYLVDATSGIATAVSFIGTSYGVENLILKKLFHLDPSTAVTITSKAIGGAYAIATGLLKFRAPLDQQYNVRQISPTYKSFPIWRGLGRVASTINSALQMWWPVSIANQAFEAASATKDVVIPVLACYAGHEFATADRRYNEGIQDTITHVGLRTMNWDNPSSSAKLNLITYVGGKLAKEIDRFPIQTVQDLYEVIFASHLDPENMAMTSAIISQNDVESAVAAAARAAAPPLLVSAGLASAKEKHKSTR